MKEVIAALKSLRVGLILLEYHLQKQIAEHLAHAGVAFVKERRLGKGMRVDFLTESGVAIEVKKGKPNRTQLYGQINRYADCPEVNAVVIVVETSLKMPISRAGNGKPCAVVGLQKMWGIAL